MAWRYLGASSDRGRSHSKSWEEIYWRVRQSRARRPISGAPRPSYSIWSARALGSYFARDRTPSGLRTDLGRYAQRLLRARCAAILSEGFSRHTAATLLPSGSLGAALSPASWTAAKLLGLFGTGGGPVSGNLVPGDLKRRSSPNLAMRTASSGPLDTSMASRVTGSGVLVKTGASP